MLFFQSSVFGIGACVPESPTGNVNQSIVDVEVIIQKKWGVDVSQRERERERERKREKREREREVGGVSTWLDNKRLLLWLLRDHIGPRGSFGVLHIPHHKDVVDKGHGKVSVSGSQLLQKLLLAGMTSPEQLHRELSVVFEHALGFDLGVVTAIPNP